MHRWKLINDALGLGQPEPVETYSTSEHLYTELDIPREATGTLPSALRDRAGLEAEAVEDIGETGRIRSPRARHERGSSGRAGSSGRGGTSGRGVAGGSVAGGSVAGGSVAGGGVAGGGGSGRGASGRGTGRIDEEARQAASPRRRRRRTRAGREIGPAQNQPEAPRQKAS
jgi:hypothetical protein